FKVRTEARRTKSYFYVSKERVSQMQMIKAKRFKLRKPPDGTSLVVQWLRICLPMQGTRV
ncbi:hypothetical protein, partial [Pseudomonas aeruginosa]|uniref:hypothetical protein n=1 Tax=Pseudomonas aeruginosa TaxID=287 RepID=UPI00397BD175